MILSNLAKSIDLDIFDKVGWKIKEFPPNYKSITDTLNVKFFKTNDIEIQVLNVFQNIKTLRLEFSHFVENSGQKINLPQLQSLKVDDMRLLKNFSKLQQLKHFHHTGKEEIYDFDEIFDPSQILEPIIGGQPNSEFLNLFQKVRSLKLYNIKENINFDKFLPQMKFLTSLTLKFTGRGNLSPQLSLLC